MLMTRRRAGLSYTRILLRCLADIWRRALSMMVVDQSVALKQFVTMLKPDIFPTAAETTHAVPGAVLFLLLIVANKIIPEVPDIS